MSEPKRIGTFDQVGHAFVRGNSPLDDDTVIRNVGCATRSREANVLVVCEKPDHPLFRDKTGMTFGRLHVDRYAGRIGDTNAYECTCQCGNKITTRGYSLSSGATRSCGCLIEDTAGKLQYKHGLRQTEEYAILAGIRNRCLNPRVKAYPRYGGRGITVCDRWLNGDGQKTGVECFVADMGQRPSPTHSIDRIDNDKGYSPDNCRWATPTDQERNKRNTKRLTFNGETKPLHEWSQSTGIPQAQIAKRLGRGWSVERALTKPLRGGSTNA